MPAVRHEFEVVVLGGGVADDFVQKPHEVDAGDQGLLGIRRRDDQVRKDEVRVGERVEARDRRSVVRDHVLNRRNCPFRQLGAGFIPALRGRDVRAPALEHRTVLTDQRDFGHLPALVHERVGGKFRTRQRVAEFACEGEPHARLLENLRGAQKTRLKRRDDEVRGLPETNLFRTAVGVDHDHRDPHHAGRKEHERRPTRPKTALREVRRVVSGIEALEGVGDRRIVVVVGGRGLHAC